MGEDDLPDSDRPALCRDPGHTLNGGLRRLVRVGVAAEVQLNGRAAAANCDGEIEPSHAIRLEPVAERHMSGCSVFAIGHRIGIIDLMTRRNRIRIPLRPLAKIYPPEQALGMPKDDRGEALGWYVRRLIMNERKLGKNQREIAERTGLTQATVSNIENAVTLPNQTTAIRFADYFRRTPGELWDEALDWWDNRGGRAEAIEADAAARLKRFAATPRPPPHPTRKRKNV